jgi:hypothetical protein
LLKNVTGKPVKLTNDCIRKIKENIKNCLKNLNYTHPTHFSNGVRFSSGDQKPVPGLKVNSTQAREIILFFNEKILETA